MKMYSFLIKLNQQPTITESLIQRKTILGLEVPTNKNFAHNPEWKLEKY